MWEHFLCATSLLVSFLSLPPSMPSTSILSLAPFYSPTLIHSIFSTNKLSFSWSNSTSFSVPRFSLCWITAGKLNILSAQERTNRQEIIFPLKSWLLSLLLTWQRSLPLWGQTVELLHEYADTQTHTVLRMVLVSAAAVCCIETAHPPTKKVWCWLFWGLLTAHYPLALL